MQTAVVSDLLTFNPSESPLGLYYSDSTETMRHFDTSLIISGEHQNIGDKSKTNWAQIESDSPRRKLHSTVVGRVMLSHDASLRKSEAASSRVAFSMSMNWRRGEGHNISHLWTASRRCKLRTQRWGWQCKLFACVCVYLSVCGWRQYREYKTAHWKQAPLSSTVRIRWETATSRGALLHKNWPCGSVRVRLWRWGRWRRGPAPWCR